jgi:hypothetical protein
MYAVVEGGAMSVISQLIDNAMQLTSHFQPVVTNDPVAALLFVGGSLLFALTIGMMGYLSIGAVLDIVSPA